MTGHRLCFYGEIWLIIRKLPCYSFLSGALFNPKNQDQSGKMDPDFGIVLEEKNSRYDRNAQDRF